MFAVVLQQVSPGFVAPALQVFPELVTSDSERQQPIE